MLIVLEMVGDLLTAAHEGAGRAARSIAHHVATTGDVRRIWRNVNDLNRRLAAMEPRGEALGICALCGGPLHLVKAVPWSTAEGAVFTRVLWRCGDCWALRPFNVPRKGGDDGASVAGAK